MSKSLPRQKKLVPISEAAKILGVSIDTVRRWDKSGVLHSERPDGKNRYFTIAELESHKSTAPLSISEVASELGISTTTLRRLEARGKIAPNRNSAGERIYDKDLIKEFLTSDYFLRKQVEEKPPKPFQSQPAPQSLELNLKPLRPHQRIPELLASVMIFLLLFSIGMTNISLPNSKLLPTNIVLAATEKIVIDDVEADLAKTAPKILSLLHTIGIGNAPVSIAQVPNSIPSPAVLSATKEVSTASAALDPKITLIVKTEDKASWVNIRQKPASNSPKIGQAKSGDTFEFISLNLGWYEVKLATQSGFISAKYIQKENN